MLRLVAVIPLLAGCAGKPPDDARPFPTPSSEGGAVATPRVLAEQQGGANDIAIDEQRVYWTNFTDDGALLAVPRQGGAPVTLAAHLAMPGRLCLDAEFVYWTSYTGGTVHRVATTGGAATQLASGQKGPAACARAGTQLFWTNFVDDGAVMRIDLASGAMPEPVAADQIRPNVVVVVVDDIYWIRSHETDGAVVRMGGSAKTTVLASGEANPYDIAVDGGHVYWTNRSGGTVRRVQVAGGSAVTLAEGQLEPLGIALDREFVYWTSFRAGTVARAPRVGGAATVLAEGQGGPRRIAVDDTSVYWTNYESGTVMSMPKP